MPHPANLFRSYPQRLTYWLNRWIQWKADNYGDDMFQHAQLIEIRIQIYERRIDLGFSAPSEHEDGDGA